MSERSRDMQRALVTGATGFIGGHLVRALLESGCEVVCFVDDHDLASMLWQEGDVERVRIVSARLEDFARTREAILRYEIDSVFHLGAQTQVGVARNDPVGTFESNIRGTWNVLEACRLAGDQVNRIIIASSDKAYGPAATLPTPESAPLAGRGPYDVSKSCADLIAQSYVATYGLPIAIARCGNVYGPHDLNFRRLVPGTIRSLLRAERPVLRSDGSPKRDYLYVSDTVSAYLALAHRRPRNEDLRPEHVAFNFSEEFPRTVLEVVSFIGLACGQSRQPVYEIDSAHEIPSQHLDSSKAHKELGWTPRVGLSDGLAGTVAWYRKHFRLEGSVPSMVEPKAIQAAEVTA